MGYYTSEIKEKDVTMYQSFEAITNPAYAAERISSLRQELNRLELDGFLVPRSDEHQGEYVPPHAQRLSWLTGFTGSSGIALILKTKPSSSQTGVINSKCANKLILIFLNMKIL